jgi:hypothetical protein
VLAEAVEGCLRQFPLELYATVVCTSTAFRNNGTQLGVSSFRKQMILLLQQLFTEPTIQYRVLLEAAIE